jgi:lipoic acid synthetase
MDQNSATNPRLLMATAPIELIPGPPLSRPEWLKIRLAADTGHYGATKDIVNRLGLHTVCQEARCPNMAECWGYGTATFMILGDVCTRACRYCAVTSGKPAPGVDADEPEHVAEAVRQMGLRHAVVTSVDRDDLPDLGAGHFAATIDRIKSINPRCTVEVLTPDFQARDTCLQIVLAARPDIFNHNIETVRRVFRQVRPGRSDYDKSLWLLHRAKQLSPDIRTKSGLMVGLGETTEEIRETMRDLKDNDVDIVTIGQYLRPTTKHVAIHRYVHPDEFAGLKAYGGELGFLHIESGPLVRSSYHAHEHASVMSN